MSGSPLDRLARALSRNGSRRWALKATVAGFIGVEMFSRGAASSQAQDTDQIFQQCLAACLAPCNSTSVCPTWEGCAASCSQAFW